MGVFAFLLYDPLGVLEKLPKLRFIFDLARAELLDLDKGAN